MKNNKDVFVASTNIAFPLRQSYRHYCLPLFANTKEKGILHFDVRHLSTADMNNEIAGSRTWSESDDKMLPFAKHLAKCAEEMCKQLCD